MKKSFLWMMIWLLRVLCSQTALAQSEFKPNHNEVAHQNRTQIQYLTKQISLLRLYYGYCKKGMAIVQGGLGLIDNIKDGKFSLDKAYLRSLGEVKILIGGDDQVKQILEMNLIMKRDLGLLQTRCFDSRAFTTKEIVLIENIATHYTSLNNCCSQQLTLIITDGTVEMSDDERLSRIDKLYAETLQRLAQVRMFSTTTTALATSRVKDRQEVLSINQFYNL